MKCPVCGYEGLKYKEQRNKKPLKKLSPLQQRKNRAKKTHSKPSKPNRLPPRTNFETICRKCESKAKEKK